MNGYKVFLFPILALIAILFYPFFFSSTGIIANFGDVFKHYYPLRHLCAEHLINGKLPLWNPYIFAGTPLLANPQAAVFYPFSILFSIFPVAAAFNYFTMLHFFAGYTFMYLLLRSAGNSNLTSVTGGTAFILSSFMVFKLPAGHLIAFSGYIWFPLLILLLFNTIQYPSRTAALLLGSVFTLQYFSGHIQPIYVSLFFTVIFLLLRRSDNYTYILAGIGIFTAASACQFIPSYELSRSAETGVWLQLSQAYSASAASFVTMFAPFHFGDLLAGTFLPQNPSYFLEKFNFYFGLVPLLLSMAGLGVLLKNKRFFWPVVVAAGLTLSLGLNTVLYNYIYNVIPGLSLLRVPARFYFLALVPLMLVFCYGWGKIKVLNYPVVKALILAVVFVDLLLVNHKFVSFQEIVSYRSKPAITSLMKPGFRINTDAEISPANRSMLFHHLNFNGYETILLENFTKYVGLQETGSFAPTGLSKPVYESPLVKGFCVKYILTDKNIPGMVDLLKGSSGIKLYDNGSNIPVVFLPETIKTIDSAERIKAYEEIKYLKETHMSPDKETIIDNIPGGFYLLNEGSSLRSFEFSPGRIKIEAAIKNMGTVVVSEIFYPGWKASAAGSRIHINHANKAFKALLLPAGEYYKNNSIYLYFQPASILLGILISLAFILSALFYLYKTLNTLKI